MREVRSSLRTRHGNHSDSLMQFSRPTKCITASSFAERNNHDFYEVQSYWFSGLMDAVANNLLQKLHATLHRFTDGVLPKSGSTLKNREKKAEYRIFILPSVFILPGSYHQNALHRTVFDRFRSETFFELINASTKSMARSPTCRHPARSIITARAAVGSRCRKKSYNDHRT